jgi:hypothetical protein
MDKDVRDMLVRKAVSELRSKYCWYVSRGDYEKVTALYTADGIFDFAMDGKRVQAKGSDAVRECLARSTFPGVVFPLIHNEVTFIDSDDKAHGVCSMEAKCTAPGLPIFSGYYHDWFRRENGTWLFAERRFYRYFPDFERSGLDMDGSPETGLSKQHDRKA